MTTNVMGENGFRWFIGTVVDRTTDPLKLGRLKVRIYGIHDDEGNTPNEELPWATIVNLPISASANQVGISPLGIMEGSIVVGFFADAAEGQMPMILGTIAAIPENDVNKHDVAKLAREENELANAKANSRVTGDLVTEPPSPYAAKYPFNKVIKTERGHVIELDDTQDHERLHMYHKVGSYTEIDKDGNRVDKIVGNKFEITVKNNNVYVGGECRVEIRGDTKVLIKGKTDITVERETNIRSIGALTMKSDASITLSAPRIDLNPGTKSSVTSNGENIITSGVPGKASYAGFVQPNLKTYKWGI